MWQPIVQRIAAWETMMSTAPILQPVYVPEHCFWPQLVEYFEAEHQPVDDSKHWCYANSTCSRLLASGNCSPNVHQGFAHEFVQVELLMKTM